MERAIEEVRMSRSNMKFILMDLLDEGAISLEDLDGFSDDLKDSLATYVWLKERREVKTGVTGKADADSKEVGEIQ